MCAGMLRRTLTDEDGGYLLEEGTGVLFASLHFKYCLKTSYNNHITRELFSQAMRLGYILQSLDDALLRRESGEECRKEGRKTRKC